MVKSTENLIKRKASGGKKKALRSRRAYEADSYAAETTLGEEKIILIRTRGGNIKNSLRSTGFANVADPSVKKVSRVKILSVVKNPAYRDYDRRGVITKGALIKTEIGTAKVVSRPGQDGVVNAVLVK